jgi:hypothetical protein
MEAKNSENGWKPVEGKPGIFVREDRSKQVITRDAVFQQIVAKLRAIEEFKPQPRRPSLAQAKKM